MITCKEDALVLLWPCPGCSISVRVFMITLDLAGWQELEDRVRKSQPTVADQHQQIQAWFGGQLPFEEDCVSQCSRNPAMIHGYIIYIVELHADSRYQDISRYRFCLFVLARQRDLIPVFSKCVLFDNLKHISCYSHCRQSIKVLQLHVIHAVPCAACHIPA